MTENFDYEVELVYSPLCQNISSDGKTVYVNFFHGDDDGWLLEVVDQKGNSTCWHDLFETDALALQEVHNTISTEGMDSLIGE